MSDFDDYFKQSRELQRTIDQFRPQLSDLGGIPNGISEQMVQLATVQDRFALPSDYLNVVTRLRETVAESIFSGTREQMEQLASVRDRFALPSDYLNEMAKLQETVASGQVSQLKALTGLVSGPAQEILQLQHQLDNWAQRLTEPTQIYLPNNRVLESLITTEALIQTQRLREELLASALQPQIAYQDFARQQLELITATVSDMERRNRLMLVDAASELLENMNRGFELAMLMNPIPPATYSVSIPTVNVYAELTVELEEIDLEESEVDIEGAVLESKPGQVTQLGGRLVQMVYNLNVEAEREGKPAVFKPTSKTLYSCAMIPIQIATDYQSFSEIIDHLYFLLYEGSGEAKRLSGRCSSDSLEALWNLKDLRTGARHDVDHGPGKDVGKKNHRIGEAYKSLIGTVVPRSRTDWLKAQISLYDQLVEMLEAVWFGGDQGEDTS